MDELDPKMPSRSDEKSSEALPLAVVLRLWIAVGLTIVLASVVTVGATLLPQAVEDTNARVWIGIGLFGATVAGLAAIGAYALHAVGEEPATRWRSGVLERADDRSVDEPTAARPEPGSTER
jgi:hypothetical protein